jgi:DNA uptake protein ComE-like DNA-binding protein
MTTPPPANRDRAGAALILAISLLALFSTLGTLYVSRMGIEVSRVNQELREARARQLAVAWVHAALGDLERALSAGQPQQVTGRPLTYEFPAYGGVFDGVGITLETLERRASRVEVTITDESGKANPNHLPASVLQRVLGVDGATARRVAGSLPREGSTDGQWLDSIDALRTRGLLDDAQFAALDRDLLTVYTVPDPAQPRESLNLNAAAPAVLAAIVDVPLEAAEAIAARRPFRNLDGLAAAAGKDAATFNIKPDPANPLGLPAPLALRSRCFRIVSRALYGLEAGSHEYGRTTGEVDAVVVFDDDGNPQFVRWVARRGIG